MFRENHKYDLIYMLKRLGIETFTSNNGDYFAYRVGKSVLEMIDRENRSIRELMLNAQL